MHSKFINILTKSGRKLHPLYCHGVCSGKIISTYEGRYEDAERLQTQLLKMCRVYPWLLDWGPLHAVILIKLAETYRGIHEYDDAMEVAEEAIKRLGQVKWGRRRARTMEELTDAMRVLAHI